MQDSKNSKIVELVEVYISLDEIKGLQVPEIYIRSKLASNGIPIYNLFSLGKEADGFCLTKDSLPNGITKFTWRKYETT
jgi:hypothetical protein